MLGTAVVVLGNRLACLRAGEGLACIADSPGRAKESRVHRGAELLTFICKECLQTLRKGPTRQMKQVRGTEPIRDSESVCVGREHDNVSSFKCN